MQTVAHEPDEPAIEAVGQSTGREAEHEVEQDGRRQWSEDLGERPGPVGFDVAQHPMPASHVIQDEQLPHPAAGVAVVAEGEDGDPEQTVREADRLIYDGN